MDPFYSYAISIFFVLAVGAVTVLYVKGILFKSTVDTPSVTTSKPATPVTDAPITDAPPTDAPITDAPRRPPTDAPITDAPRRPPTDAPISIYGCPIEANEAAQRCQSLAQQSNSKMYYNIPTQGCGACTKGSLDNFYRKNCTGCSVGEVILCKNKT